MTPISTFPQRLLKTCKRGHDPKWRYPGGACSLCERERQARRRAGSPEHLADMRARAERERKEELSRKLREAWALRRLATAGRRAIQDAPEGVRTA